MSGLGWQELVILLVYVAVIWVVPLTIVVKGTRRRTGSTQTGWVVATVFFGWLAVGAWALFDARRY